MVHKMGKKLLFFIPTLENGAGMERISTSLANLLVEKGYKVAIAEQMADPADAILQAARIKFTKTKHSVS